MALLVLPNSLTFSFSPNRVEFLPRTRLHRPSHSVKLFSMQAEAKAQSNDVDTTASAVLWFKHDLRIDDHPGLVAASQYRTVIPLYVFDHRILSRFSDEMLELLLFSLEDLRKSLKNQGSDLMMRFGRAENVIQKLVKEVKATKILAEEEVEYELRRMMDIIEDTLTTASFAEGKPKFVLWNTPFYDIKNLKDLPAFHQDFKKLKLPIFSPLLPPKLPELKMDLAYGDLPTMEDLKKFMNDASGKSKGDLISLKKTSAENLLQKEEIMTSGKLIEDLKFSRSWEKSQKSSSYKNAKRKRPENSAFITQQGNVVGGGTELVLNALAAYLRYLEGTARDDFQEVHEKLRDADNREGASFGALFRPALDLGIISRRKVYYEAIKYERERNGGFISLFGFSASTIAAAVNTVCSMEWYFLMALKSQTFKEGTYSIKIWRWKGYLIQYTFAGHDGPAVLLVHGFGAFLEHYRDNIYRIAEGGNQVWAITLLGFGKSEKPNILYTELIWAELLRDFIIDVVGQPVHLVGNSIGGYFVAMVAGLWPALAKSVILLNSAGNIIPGYSSVPYTKERRTSLAAWMGARLLLIYLKLRIKNIVKNCYPKRTDQADDWLINEMIRASYDPGVLVVLESMFSFDLSVPLNYLLDGFERRVLLIQGMQDPLADSKSKLAMLKEHCRGIVAREIDAGHCPHDEIPEEVNSFIREWLVTMESKILVGQK